MSEFENRSVGAPGGSISTDEDNASGDADSNHEDREAFGEAVGRLGPVLLGALDALEYAFRHLHPPQFSELRLRLAPVRVALDDARSSFAEITAPATLDAFRVRLGEAAQFASESLGGLVDPGAPEQGAMRAIRAMHQHARSQAQLYPLRDALPPVSSYFAEPHCRDRLESLEAREGIDERVGLFRSGEIGARGGFDLYVPESYDASEPWPLVVALHGGSGNGADFLWSWLREARSRRFLLMAPTSRDSTWSLHAPELDGEVLRKLTQWVMAKWRVDSGHVLLTGLSDGATMTLLTGLAQDTPYTHLAPVSGVLHPMNFAIGNLDRARDKPIYLVHGALDWLFPVALAQEAARVLEDAHAKLLYREIEDLSHTYPREENARIVEWMLDVPG